jgi:DNA-binding HxlR family transcriptional regulator
LTPLWNRRVCRWASRAGEVGGENRTARDVYAGINRFEKIQDDLGISRKVLAERLRWLVDQDILQRRQYSQRPPRFEYALTVRGMELCDLLLVMVRWGDRWTAGAAGPPVVYRHHACGEIAHVDLACSHCGQPMRAGDVDILPGPGAAPA